MGAVFLSLGLKLEAALGGAAPRTTVCVWLCSRSLRHELG